MLKKKDFQNTIKKIDITIEFFKKILQQGKTYALASKQSPLIFLMRAFQVKADCFYEQKKLSDAIHWYEMSLKNNSKDIYIINRIGLCYLHQHKYDHAKSYFVKAIELDPTNTDIWNNRGKCDELLGYYDDALQCYEKAIELDGNNMMAIENKQKIK